MRRPPADHQRQDGRDDAGRAGDHEGLQIIALGGAHEAGEERGASGAELMTSDWP